MKIFVKVKPNAKETKVISPPQKLISDGDKEYYIVSVKEPPMQGKANQAVIEALAEYFGVSKSQVHLISGLSSKTKVIEIDR